MTFNFIAGHKPQELSVQKACDIFHVSRSGYFSSMNKHKGLKNIKNKEQKIVKAFHKNKGLYGYRKVLFYLKKRGYLHTEYQVRKVLKSKGLQARKAKAFKPVTTYTDKSSPISPRVFQIEQTVVTRLNQVWSSDITYLKAEGSMFLYLAVFLDVFSRRVVGWELSSCLSGEFVLKALFKGIRTRSIEEKLIIHSDRGVQYTCAVFRKSIKDLGFVQSMSRKGNCYDNAHCESFFSLFKREMKHKVYGGSIVEVRQQVFEWIEGWYNTRRIHSSLGYKSPAEFEKMVQKPP